MTERDPGRSKIDDIAEMVEHCLANRAELEQGQRDFVEKLRDYHELGRLNPSPKQVQYLERIYLRITLRQKGREHDPTAAIPAMRELCDAAIAQALEAMHRFPQPNYVLTKIAEEAGEVVKTGVHLAEGRDFEWPDLEAECVQTIAMCLRLLVEGDQVIGLTPPQNTPEIPAAGSNEPAHPTLKET